MQSSINESLILPSEIALVPVADFPEEMLSQLSYEMGDIAITRVQSRTPTRIISADLASLLQEFSTANTVVEAILLNSVRHAADPREMLETAYPFLLQMVGEQLLVPADENGEPAAAGGLQRGSQIDGFTIEKVLHSLLDTELYQVRDDSGTLFALKLAKDSGNTVISRIIKHETEVLRYLEGGIAPRFVDQGTHNDQPYLAMEWCPGVSVDQAARELRDSRDPKERVALAELCTAVLAAYAELHERHTIHGDIHPGNILVDMGNRVHIIDYGLARVVDDSHMLNEPHRGGVAFFCEPEYCSASLAHKPPPRASFTGEQYSLAALVYYLFSGANYLDFSLEEEVLWRQILVDRPLPFAHHDVKAWPEVEAALHKALSKEPEDRYKGVAEFRDALENAASSNTVDSIPLDIINPSDRSGDAYVSDILERLDWNGALFNEGLPRAPFASIEYGAAGIAYFLYRAACTRSDPRLLALADLWATEAERLASEEEAFTNPELDITYEAVGRISPFHSRSGLYMMRFLLAQAAGDEMTQAMALTAFVHEAGQDCQEIDMTLGSAGVLLSGAFLYELLPDAAWADESGLLDLGAGIQQRLWERMAGYSDIKNSTDLSNLGAAHGWAGLLYAALQWSAITGADLPQGIEDRLQQLAGLAEYAGRGMQWPWDLAHTPLTYIPGWCNGSAGHLFLWTTAYRIFGEQRYLDLAVRSGWHTWEGGGTSVTLCCGLAGRAYALLNLYRLTADEAWLDRARELGRQAAVLSRNSEISNFEGFENSLYKGEVGIAALLVDLEDPDHAAMPFFESITGQLTMS